MSATTERTKVVYIAGPVSLGGTCSVEEIAAFVGAFRLEARRLRAAGYEVLDPTELSERPTWADYMKATLPMVCAADLVVVLPRWRESRGAWLEAFVASQLGVPVVDADSL